MAKPIDPTTTTTLHDAPVPGLGMNPPGEGFRDVGKSLTNPVRTSIPENQTLVLYREQRKAQEDAQVLRECDRWDRLVWMILEHKNGHGPPDCDCSGCRLWHVLQEDEAVNDQVSEGSSGDGSSDGFVSLEHEQEEMRPMTQTHKGSDTPYSRGGMPSRIGDLPSGSGDPGEGSESDDSAEVVEHVPIRKRG